MATGGAWQSETFDNGQNTWPAQASPAMQLPAGMPPPAMYNPPAGSRGEAASMGTIMLALRVPQFLFSLIAIAITASNKLHRFYYSVDFTDISAYIALVVMNAIVCLHALVQLVISVVNRSAAGSFAPSPTTTHAKLTFVSDATLAFALMAVSAAAAEVVAPSSPSSSACSSIFCQKAAAAIAMSFFAWAAVAAAAALYPVRLLRLIKR